MNRSLIRCPSAMVITFAAIACSPSQQLPPRGPVAVYEEPFHHLVFENALTRVLDVRVPAGDTTLYHVHANPLVGVSIQDARAWQQNLGAPPDSIEAPSPVPYVFENWNRELPYTHRDGNADTSAFHYIVGEWLRSSGIDCSPLPEMDNRHLVKEGKFVRVYEVRLAPHTSTNQHTHVCPGLIVLGTTGTLTEDGTAPAAGGGAGAGRWEWLNAGHRHVLSNTGSTPLTVFEIDWR